MLDGLDFDFVEQVNRKLVKALQEAALEVKIFGHRGHRMRDGASSRQPSQVGW